VALVTVFKAHTEQRRFKTVRLRELFAEGGKPMMQVSALLPTLLTAFLLSSAMPHDTRDGVLVLLMGWVLVLNWSPQPDPQPSPDLVLGERIAESVVRDRRLWLRGTLAKNSFGNRSGGLVQAEPPRILYIYREFWKPGTQADLDRIETKGARMCIDLKCPHPYLGIESLTGSKEVWYLNGFTSIEEQNRVKEEYNKKGLFAAMNQFTQQRAPFQSEPGKESFSNYYPELSHGLPWSMGRGRFLVIVVTKGNPQSDGTVFETEEGMRFIVTPAETRAEANAKLCSAGPGAKIFAVRPHFSMPASEWVAADPLFWGSAPRNR
jgi:hypothetical protein